ncbi:MAG: hypothetical protein ABL907_09215 [Hyphomicrobium sp.]
MPVAKESLKSSGNLPALAAALTLAVVAAVGALLILTVHGTEAAINYLTPEALEFVAAHGGFI